MDYLPPLEAKSPIKHEYVNGKVYAMAGATDAHVTIAGNLFAMLRSHVRGTDCRVDIADMKLRGDGSRASLQDIRSWDFPDVELMVLSACETAVGDVPLGNGAEVLGLGYLMQLAGAEAAIASLWQVSDGGTQVLMDAFYAALNNGYSKAEALQRAQQALITSDETVLEGDRGNATIEIIDTRTGQPLAQSTDLAHPYYWAPFILIGNGL
ncbi:MAG TPA: CHAT domain-containing protein [Candidatus Obscuribacterales bacterium]